MAIIIVCRYFCVCLYIICCVNPALKNPKAGNLISFYNSIPSLFYKNVGYFYVTSWLEFFFIVTKILLMLMVFQTRDLFPALLGL